MPFAVRFLRYRGRVLPRQGVANRQPRSGALRAKQFYDEELRRHVRCAPGRPGDALTLLDVRLIAMSPQAFTLAGMERCAGAEYAQSWLVSHVA